MSIRRTGNTGGARRRGTRLRPRNLPEHPPRLGQTYAYVAPPVFTIGVSIIGGGDEIG